MRILCGILWEQLRPALLHMASNVRQDGVRFDFAKPQKFVAVMIWNHNQCNLTDRGIRKTRLYGTSDGVKWFSLTAPLDEIELPRSGSGPEYATTIRNADARTQIKSIIIAATMKDGNYGGSCYGLNAVRFVVDHPQ